MAKLSKGFDPDQPRAEDGKWTNGGGGGGGAAQSPKERAAAALEDPAFRAEHASRLQAADREARSNFPGKETSDHANQAASNHTHGEAQRIHAEQDAHGGEEQHRAAADEARAESARRGDDLQTQHQAAMSAIESSKAYAAVRASGLVPAVDPSVERLEAIHAEHNAKLDEIHADLDKHHAEAVQSLRDLHELHTAAHGEDSADERLPDATGLADTYLQTASDIGGDRETSDYADAKSGLPEHLSNTANRVAELRDQIDVNEDTGEAEPWSRERFDADHVSPGYEHLEFDNDGAAVPWNESGASFENNDALPHDQDAYQSEYEHYTAAENADRAAHEQSGKSEPWSRERFQDEHPYGYDHLEFHEDDGSAAPWENSNAKVENDEAELPHDQAGYEAEHQAYTNAEAAHRAAYEQAANEYTQARGQLTAAARDKAIETQTRLEALHAKQVAAHDSLKAMDSATTKAANEARGKVDISDEDIAEHVSAHPRFANEDVEVDEATDTSTFADPKADEDFSHATDAYRSDIEAANERVEELSENPRHGEDTRSGLKESIRQTGDAIRQLSKITGRAAALAKPAARAKKSAPHRCCPECGRRLPA